MRVYLILLVILLGLLTIEYVNGKEFIYYVNTDKYVAPSNIVIKLVIQNPDNKTYILYTGVPVKVISNRKPIGSYYKKGYIFINVSKNIMYITKTSSPSMNTTVFTFIDEMNDDSKFYFKRTSNYSIENDILCIRQDLNYDKYSMLTFTYNHGIYSGEAIIMFAKFISGNDDILLIASSNSDGSNGFGMWHGIGAPENSSIAFVSFSNYGSDHIFYDSRYGNLHYNEWVYL